MPLVKHDYPVLEYDTASKAVFQPGNGKKCFPAKAVFAFLGDEVENYAHTHDGIQIDGFLVFHLNVNGKRCRLV